MRGLFAMSCQIIFVLCRVSPISRSNECSESRGVWWTSCWIIRHDATHSGPQCIVGQGNLQSIHMWSSLQLRRQFGVSCFVFTGYFPMGESTIHKCVSHFCRGLVSCPELSAFERRSSSSEVKPFEQPPVFLPFFVLSLPTTEASSASSDMAGARGSIDCDVRVGRGDQLIVMWGWWLQWELWCEHWMKW